MRSLCRKIPVPVLASVLLHAALTIGLLRVTGVVDGVRESEPTTVVTAQTEHRVEPEPEPWQVPAPTPDAPAIRNEVAVKEIPLAEPPIFPADPEPLPAGSVAPPSTLSRCPNRRVIGIGGGGVPGRRAAPPPPPAPKGRTASARPMVRPAPSYPRLAVKRNLEGEVLLLVEVLPTGRIGRIQVRKSSGHRILDDAAVQAVKEWRFEAALANGVPVRSFVEIPFVFELRGRR